MFRTTQSLLKEIVDLSHLSVQRAGLSVIFLPSNKRAFWLRAGATRLAKCRANTCRGSSYFTVLCRKCLITGAAWVFLKVYLMELY